MKNAVAIPGRLYQDGHEMSTIIRCVRTRDDQQAQHLCGDYEVIARVETDWQTFAPMFAAAPQMLVALETIALHCPSLDAAGIREYCYEAIRAARGEP